MLRWKRPEGRLIIGFTYLLCLQLLAGTCVPAYQMSAAGESGRAAPEQLTLPNGLKVLLLEDHSFPVVSCLIWYRVGARNESLGTTGLSHLVEHLLFKNVGSFRKGELGATIARNGGQFNGYTSDDFTSFFETLPPSKLELALKVEAERMHSATFSAGDVKEEVAHIQSEFERDGKDPLDALAKEVRAIAYQQHPYHNPTMGWRNDVENLTALQAKSFYEQYYRPDNATLVLVGDFPSAEAAILVKKHFGVLSKPQNPIPEIRSSEPSQKGERRVSMKYLGKQEVLQVAYHAPAISDSDAPAMILVEKLLNAPYSGRLRSKLIDPKICSSALSVLETKRDPGLFSVICYATPGNGQQKVLESVEAVLNQLKAQPLTDAELKRAKNLCLFNYLSESDGPYHAGFHMGFFDTMSAWKSASQWPDRVKAVTPADVQHVAKKYFNPDNRVIGWLSSPNVPKPAPPPDQAVPKDKDQVKPMPRAKQAVEHFPIICYKLDDSSPGPTAEAVSPETSDHPVVEEDVPGAAAMPLMKFPLSPSLPQSSSSRAASQSPVIPPAAETTGTPPASHAGAAAAATQTGAQIPALRPPITQPGQPAAGTKPGSTPAERQVILPRLQKLHHRILKNGLRLIVFETHLCPVLQISGSIRAGDVFDPPGKTGMALLATAVLNNGSARHNRGQIISMQEDMGLPPNAMLKFEAGAESITFNTKCLSQDLASQVALLSEVLSSPSLQEDDPNAKSPAPSPTALDKAKSDAVNAIKKAEESLPARLNRALLQSLIATGSAYCPISAPDRIKGINGLKTADVKSFFGQCIVPEGTTMVIAGDVSPDLAAEVVEKQLAGWQSKGGAPKKPVVQPNTKRVLRTFIPIRDKTQTTVCVGQLLPLTRSQPDFGSLLLTDCVLTNHPVLSRLSQRFLNEPDLACLGNDELETTLVPISNATTWSISMSLDEKTVAPAVQSLMTELKKLGKSGVSAEELNEAKRYLLGAIPVRYMSSVPAMSKSILDSITQDGGPDLNPLLLSVRAANFESVNKFIRNTFKPDQASIVVVGDTQAIKAVRQQTSESPQPKSVAAKP